MSDSFANSACPPDVKLDNFPKYVRRQRLSRFLALYELFKLQLDVKGCIVECGVHHGAGLMTWAKLSAALEPYALDRRVFGFDTFEGFPGLAAQDAGAENAAAVEHGLAPGYDALAELTGLIAEFDANRPLAQFPKVFLQKGDATQTIPAFVKENPYLLVSLLFCDFDLYEPTKVALEHFLPRMPKGAILAFDEVNNPWWPGETQAMLEMLDLRNHRLTRFTFDPSISYIVL
jgi:hypothetical protein